MKMTSIPVLLVLCCWLAAEASGQRFQQQRLEQTPAARQPQQKQEDAPYYQDSALPRSAPAIPRYYPPAPVHYVSIGEKLDGEYRFGYDSGNGPLGHSFRQEFRLPDGSIRGSYGYVDSRGHMRRVHYTAGKSGFVILKDERILDKEPPKDTLLGKDDLPSTTASPAKNGEVPQRAQQLLPRAPQFQDESRNAETQQSPRTQVAPVPLPSKSAQEIQAEYFRSRLYASGTVASEQYAKPDTAVQPAVVAEEQPPQQPPQKPRIARPRPHRRRKRPKKTTTTTSTTTTEAPAQEAKSEEATREEEPPKVVEAPEPQPSPAPKRPSSIVRPRKLHRPPLAHVPPLGQRQTPVQGPTPLQSPPLEQGPQLAQFPIPEVRRPTQLQRVSTEQQELPQAQRTDQGHGAPQVIQRHRRPPATAAPPPVQERQPQGPRDIEVQRAPQRFGSARRQSHIVREPEVERAPPTRAEPAVEPYVPPPSIVDSTHGIAAGTNFGFGMRLSGRRSSQTIVAQSDESRDPEVQAEERPTASPRHRSRYHTTRRTRRPTLSIESEFPDLPVTRAPHRAAAGLSSKRRRVKVSRPLQLPQVSTEEVTTPAPTTTTPEPLPTTTSSIVTPGTLPVGTVPSTPGLVTPVFPSAEQSFYRTHGLPQGPYNTYGQAVTVPQQPFTQPSLLTPPVTQADTAAVTPAPRETPLVANKEPDTSPGRPVNQPKTVVSQQGPLLGQPGAFPLSPRGQFGQPSLLQGQAPPHLSSPFPQRPIYQLPGFNPGQGPPVPQHYFPPLGAPFVPRNSTFVENVPVPGQPRVSEGAHAQPLRNRTSEAFPLPVQRSFVDASGAAQGGFGQQRPALANPFPAVQPAHVFGPPTGSVPQFGGFRNQYSGAPFSDAPTPGLVNPQLRGQTPLTLPNQAAATASQTTPSHHRNSFVTEATPGGNQANDLGTTPLSLSSPSTAAEDQYVDEVGTTLQLPTPAPPPASSLSTLSGDRTTSAPFEYQTSRPSGLQFQTPSRPGEQFATSPGVPLYQTTPRPALQFQQSLEPQQRTTPTPQSEPSAPGAPPSSQNQFRLGTPQQQQQNTLGAQPQLNSIGGAQQGYDPFQQQFGGGYQVGNNLFSPVQQTAQDLGGGYQYPDSGPFQAQFGGPYQPQYTTIDDYSQYQGSGLGDIRGSGTNQQGYRATTPPVVDSRLLSYDIGVPYRS